MEISGHKTRPLSHRLLATDERAGTKDGIPKPRCKSNWANQLSLLESGEPGGTRTRDHRIKSAMLYQLSYRPGGLLELLLQDIIGAERPDPGYGQRASAAR